MFKHGDKVRCIKISPWIFYLTKNKIYEVIFISNNMIYVINDNYFQSAYSISRFKKVNKPYKRIIKGLLK